ncbi:MAG: alpha/beta fold hydrolase [Pseudolysinimonas sp.]
MTTHTITRPSPLDLTIDESGPEIGAAEAARTVLVLHGGGGPFTVAPIAAHFASDSTVLVPTLPGWNGTPRPEWLADVPALAAVYLQLLSDRGVSDVLVIGSSLGGWIATEMAASDTEHRVGRIVVIDGAGIDVPGAPVVDFAALSPREQAEHSWHDADTFFVDPSTLPPERIAAQRSNMQTMGALTRAHGMSDPALQARLGEVRIPALLVWGDSDGVFTPSYGRAYAAMLGNAHFELIADAGHLPQLEQPAATFAAIDGFLSA